MRDDQEAYRLSIPAMGSVIDLRWIPNDVSSGADPGRIGDDLRSDIDRWVEVMSDYQQDSQVNEFCRKAEDGNWHQPSSDLWRVLQLCDEWNRWSLGAFDASLGALTRLRRSKKEVTSSQWEQASRSCGWDAIEWDYPNARLRFKRPGVRFDFGAIGKGFVVDRLSDRLGEFGVSRYCVNASGNMAFGESPKPRVGGWPVKIGLVDQPDRSLCSMRLANCGIATSGDLHQKFRDRPVDSADDRTSSDKGATSSHILDPSKQLGLRGSAMATVITNDATNADAFATSCCVHATRGTLRDWLSRLENREFGYASDFEVWVQSSPGPDQAPKLIHWS